MSQDKIKYIEIELVYKYPIEDSGHQTNKANRDIESFMQWSNEKSIMMQIKRNEDSPKMKVFELNKPIERSSK
jgi:hypothetical protein